MQKYTQNIDVYYPCFRILGNIVYIAKTEIAEKIIEMTNKCDFFFVILKNDSTNSNLKKEILWILSNLVVNTSE